jgi:hypothetical protein
VRRSGAGVLMVPFRVFGFAARPCVLEDAVLLLADWLLVQSFRPAEVTPVLLRRSRYAVGRFLGYAVFLQRAVPESVKKPPNPLFEFGLRLEPFPTKPSRPCRSVANSSHGLCFPFST